MLYVGLRNAAESTWSWITTFPLSFRTNSICKNVNKLAVSVLLHSCFQALVSYLNPWNQGSPLCSPWLSRYYYHLVLAARITR